MHRPKDKFESPILPHGERRNIIVKWLFTLSFSFPVAMGFAYVVGKALNWSASKIISDIESNNAPVQIVQYKPNGDSVVYDSIKIAHYKIRNGTVSFEHKGVPQEFSNFRIIK